MVFKNSGSHQLSSSSSAKNGSAIDLKKRLKVRTAPKFSGWFTTIIRSSPRPWIEFPRIRVPRIIVVQFADPILKGLLQKAVYSALQQLRPTERGKIYSADSHATRRSLIFTRIDHMRQRPHQESE